MKIEICSCCGKPKRPKIQPSSPEEVATAIIQEVQRKGRWPSNFVLCHVPPDENGKGGCERVGVKRVKSQNPKYRNEGKGATRQVTVGPGPRPTNIGIGYADPDGYEHVDAWRCTESCPARKLGEQSGIDDRQGNKTYPQSPTEFWGMDKGDTKPEYADKGTAARFFFQADWEYECAEGCPVARLDEQAGERKGSKEWKGVGGGGRSGGIMGEPKQREYNFEGYYDSGGPSRFYHNADWSHEVAERIATADPVRYCPKASRKERDAGLEEWAKRDVPYSEYRENYKDTKDFVTHYPDSRLRPVNKLRNPHPTVKPISLCKWLATLLLPPGEYAPRRILIPFSGSGSEMIASGLAGWEEIVGIDFEQDYCDIAKARLAHWLGKPVQLELI